MALLEEDSGRFTLGSHRRLLLHASVPNLSTCARMPPRRALANVRSTKEASDTMSQQLVAADQLAETLRSDLGRQKALMQSAECEQLKALGARVEALQSDKAEALAKLKVHCSTL